VNRGECSDIGGRIAQIFVGAQHPVILTSFAPLSVLNSAASRSDSAATAAAAAPAAAAAMRRRI